MLIIYRILNHITFAQKHPKVPLSCQTRCRSLVMHLVPEMTVLTSAFWVMRCSSPWPRGPMLPILGTSLKFSRSFPLFPVFLILYVQRESEARLPHSLLCMELKHCPKLPGRWTTISGKSGWVHGTLHFRYKAVPF